MSAAAASVVRVLLLGRSGPLGNRIFAYTAPQDAKHPYLVYGRRGGRPEYHMLGEGGLGRSTVDIEAWAETYAQLVAIDEIIRQALSAYRGTVQADGVSYSVRRMHITNEDEGTVAPRAGSGAPIYHLSKELEVDLAQSIPTH